MSLIAAKLWLLNFTSSKNHGSKEKSSWWRQWNRTHLWSWNVSTYSTLPVLRCVYRHTNVFYRASCKCSSGWILKTLINPHTYQLHMCICLYVYPHLLLFHLLTVKYFCSSSYSSPCPCGIHFVQLRQLVYVTACGLDLSGCHQNSGNQNEILEMLFRSLCGSLALKVFVGCVIYVMVAAYPVAALWYYWIMSL